MSFRVREKRVWHSFGAPTPERGSPFGLASQTSICKLLNSDSKSRLNSIIYITKKRLIYGVFQLQNLQQNQLLKMSFC